MDWRCRLCLHPAPFLNRTSWNVSEAWKRLPWLRLIFSDMICMNAHLISPMICIYPLQYCHLCICLELWTIHNAWPVTSPLHISMILHDLLSTLKTSLYRCMLSSPGSCGMLVHNMARPTSSMGWKVREKILQLAVPYWMWVLWPSWQGNTFIF